MIHLRRRSRASGGRLASLGQDHDRGHREYVANLPPELGGWLRTKPFSAPPTYELARCLHSFAHIVDTLMLGPRAEILDVGCGPGWLSEWLGRCGYQVTGIDISEQMIAIARERAGGIGPLGNGLEASMEFHVTPVHELPWSDRFDAAVLYDAMHHFHDERATLRAIRRALVPGGRIYIHEGVRPEPGSEGERQLIEEMERFGTLESPFDGEYLEKVVREAGFTEVRRYVEVDTLADLSDERGAQNRLRDVMRHPATNTLTAMNPVPEGTSGTRFAATVVPVGGWSRVDGGRYLTHTLTVTNTGSSLWPASREFPPPPGTVNVGPYVRAPDGGRAELPRILLPHAVPPGAFVDVELRVPAERMSDTREVLVDLVREQITWLNEPGMPLLVLSLDESLRGD